jgi:DNA-binding GntR family transcriptional regulator
MGISRPALREHIKEALLKRILDGAYAPGERIVETRVAQEFEVSQGPVREALRELESLRLVVTEPHRGARVRKVSREELLEIYPVRAALEEVAGRAAWPALHEDAHVLRDELDALFAAAEAQDVNAFSVHDVALHRAVFRAAGNRTLQELWESLHVHTRTTITLLGVDDLRPVAESHRPIVEAFERGTAAQAGRELRRHIESYGRQLRVRGDSASADPG